MKEQSIDQFLEELSSKKGVPGGGTAAGLLGGIGVSLCNMVSSLTVEKEGYEEYQELNQKVLKEGLKQKEKYLQLMAADSKAFNGFPQVYKLPQDTEEEKNIRKRELEKFSKECAKIPYELMELGEQSLDLILSIEEKSNKTVISDLGIGALALKSAVQGGWLNIIINLGYIEDKTFKEEYYKKGKLLKNRVEEKTKKVYEKVEKELENLIF